MLILILLMALLDVQGQSNKIIDSLHLVLKDQNGISKVNTLNELAWELKKVDAKNATKYANLAYFLSDSISYDNGRKTSLNRLGTISIFQKQYNEAEKIYLKVLLLEVNANDLYGIGRAQNQLSEIYRKKNDLNKSLKFGLNSISNFEKINSEKNIALLANNIGMIYLNNGKLDSSMYFLLKSLTIREKMNDTKNIGFNYLNLGLLEISMQNYKKGIKYLLKSENYFKTHNDSYELSKVYNNLGIAYFELEDYNKALVYYQKSLKLKKEFFIDDKDAAAFNNIGTIYYSLGRNELAIENYLKSLKIDSQNIDGNKWIDAYINLGHIYFSREDFKKAIKYYNVALIKAKNSGRNVEYLEILKNLSYCYAKINNHDLAYKYSNLLSKIRDSLDYNYKNAVILKEEYEEQKNEKQLSKKDKVIEQIKVEKLESDNKKKLILIYSLLIVLILLTLLFLTYSRVNKMRQKHFLAQKDFEIEKQKVNELLKIQELKSINAMIEGQEGERKRIARDLHDRLGSILSMVKIHFKSVEDNIESLKISNLKQYEKANELLDNACDEVRKISHDMMSGVLSKFGLIPALEDLKETLVQSERLDVEFVTHGIDNRLENEVEIAIYRIIQELISNTLKYANATEISIQLLKGKNNLNVIVEDNGIGFDINKEVKGIGLKNIYSRVSMLDGEMNIDSLIGKGTTVTIDIPLKEN